MTNAQIKEKYFKNDTVLWEGSPNKVPVFSKADFLLVPFSLIFGGFLLGYAILSAIAMLAGQGILFSLTGITFLILGIYLIFLRLWYRKKRISREVYFVTNKRVFGFDTMRDNVLFDIPLRDVELCLGYKSLELGEANSIGDFIYGLGLDIFFRKFSKETPAFKYIDNIEKVCKIIISNIEKEDGTDDDSLFI
ncbi:MAG: hypothetical protein IJC10_04530 [Clostridia bacterium]|nr:hypothetical protein [Clostridia bacterium]